eukprot:GHVO01044782.1.p1 GENE.GHVO01044782.1~~GHVO01044782.1.p1  ORF type:complete len:366 (+),score=56.29 GHVO01044782.1:50-1147(+)
MGHKPQQMTQKNEKCIPVPVWPLALSLAVDGLMRRADDVSMEWPYVDGFDSSAFVADDSMSAARLRCIRERVRSNTSCLTAIAVFTVFAVALLSYCFVPIPNSVEPKSDSTGGHTIYQLKLPASTASDDSERNNSPMSQRSDQSMSMSQRSDQSMSMSPKSDQSMSMSQRSGSPSPSNVSDGESPTASPTLTCGADRITPETTIRKACKQILRGEEPEEELTDQVLCYIEEREKIELGEQCLFYHILPPKDADPEENAIPQKDILQKDAQRYAREWLVYLDLSLLFKNAVNQWDHPKDIDFKNIREMSMGLLGVVKEWVEEKCKTQAELTAIYNTCAGLSQDVMPRLTPGCGKWLDIIASMNVDR